MGRLRIVASPLILGDLPRAGAVGRATADEGQGMTEVQGWIVIALLVIIVFSQWYLRRG